MGLTLAPARKPLNAEQKVFLLRGLCHVVQPFPLSKKRLYLEPVERRIAVTVDGP